MHVKVYGIKFDCVLIASIFHASTIFLALFFFSLFMRCTLLLHRLAAIPLPTPRVRKLYCNSVLLLLMMLVLGWLIALQATNRSRTCSALYCHKHYLTDVIKSETIALALHQNAGKKVKHINWTNLYALLLNVTLFYFEFPFQNTKYEILLQLFMI